jgi:hypothetical protein
VWLARDVLKIPKLAPPELPRAALLTMVLLVPLALWLPYERLMPLTSQSWDAWAIWLFKAKAFYLDGGVSTFLSRAGEFTTQPGYPLLVPLYATFLYELNGQVADQMAKLLSPCSYLALLGVFYYFARRAAAHLAAAAFTLMLATAPVLGLVAFELAGYADTTLALYVLAAGGFLALWVLDGVDADLAGASLAATAAAWTKNEGQFFLLAIVLVAALQMLRAKSPLRAWFVLAVPPLLVLGPWYLVRQAHQVEAAGFALGVSFQPDLFRIALRTLLAKAFQPGLFNLSFYVALGAVLAIRPLRISRAFWILPGLVAWHLGGALLAYSTGRNDIHWWLATSADRILSQVVPLALLSAAWVWGRWSEQAVAEGQASPAEQSARAANAPRVRKGKRERRSKPG